MDCTLCWVYNINSNALFFRDKGGEMSNNSQSKVAGETNAGAMDTTIPNIVVERKISIDKNMNGKISDNEETILPSADIKTTITNNYAVSILAVISGS